MSLQDTKYWASISIDGIKKALTDAPKKVNKTEKYGQQLSADVKFWDDGGASISVSVQNSAGEWDRIHIGKMMVSKTQDTPPAQQLDPPAGSAGGFDSPF